MQKWCACELFGVTMAIYIPRNRELVGAGLGV